MKATVVEAIHQLGRINNGSSGVVEVTVWAHTCLSVPISGQPTSPTGNGDVGGEQAAEGNVQPSRTPPPPPSGRSWTGAQYSGLGGHWPVIKV